LQIAFSYGLIQHRTLHTGKPMDLDAVFQNIKQAIDAAPRNDYTAEIHLQVIKYADQLQEITAKDFCAGVGLANSYGTEFAKMRKIAERLRNAGLDPAKI
jgi:hypothetical protein